MTQVETDSFKVAPEFADLPLEDLGEGITVEHLYPPEEIAALRAHGLTDDAILELTQEQEREILAKQGLRKPRDESGSGGFRFMRDCHAKGMKYEQARAAIPADKTKAGEWANRVEERQLARAWKNSKPSGQRPIADLPAADDAPKAELKPDRREVRESITTLAAQVKAATR